MPSPNSESAYLDLFPIDKAFPGANYFLGKFEAEFDIEPADYIDTDLILAINHNSHSIFHL